MALPSVPDFKYFDFVECEILRYGLRHRTIRSRLEYFRHVFYKLRSHLHDMGKDPDDMSGEPDDLAALHDRLDREIRFLNDIERQLWLVKLDLRRAKPIKRILWLHSQAALESMLGNLIHKTLYTATFRIRTGDPEITSPNQY